MDRLAVRPRAIPRATRSPSVSDWTDLPLPPGPPVVAAGAHLHSTVCVAGPHSATMTALRADLDDPDAGARHEQLMRQGVDALQRASTPAAAFAHDRHPDFPSTRHAQALGTAHGIPCHAIQHHHAHLAAVWAEHAAHEGSPRLVGLALDGFGLGLDGGAWGGELLHLDGAHMRRLGHLTPVPMPGGEAAVAQPWRLAVAALHDAGDREAAWAHAQACAPPALAQGVMALLDHGHHCPPTSSLGRLFEAGASLLTVCHVQTHSAEAAQALEAAAQAEPVAPPLPDGWRWQSAANGLNLIDFRPLMAQLPHWASSIGVATAAARFHATVSSGLSQWLIDAARTLGCDTVALGGGCLHNRRLRDSMRLALEGAGLRCLMPSRLPAGDEAIAYGQAVVTRLNLAYH